MTDPIAWTNGLMLPEARSLAASAVRTGSVRSSQMVAPAIVAAINPMMATRLTLNRTKLMASASLAPPFGGIDGVTGLKRSFRSARMTRVSSARAPRRREGTSSPPRARTGHGRTMPPPAARQAFETLLPRGCSDVFDDNIDAAVGGELTNALDDVFVIVVDDLVSPELPCLRDLVGAAGRRNHSRLHQPCNLNRGLPDATARGEHEHGLASSDVRARLQHVPRRQKCQRKRGGLYVADMVRQRDEVLHRHRNKRRIAARR